MAKKKKRARRARKNVAKEASSTGYVAVSNPSYGTSLKGVRIYYEGGRPARLRDDGSIQFGKNILEIGGFCPTPRKGIVGRHAAVIAL